MTARAALPPRFSGELGLGICLACLGELMVDERDAAKLQFAITLAPMLWPPGRADGVPVAVPACWDHVQKTAEAAGRVPLVVANGKLPRRV